ncbi:hypothetical protein [Gardnerella swidsinskii]|uniref:hypothetical protein n=1 Tax=Gardnerella swidsinskii TaxID=2792979 RepID=UPI0036F489BE
MNKMNRLKLLGRNFINFMLFILYSTVIIFNIFAPIFITVNAIANLPKAKGFASAVMEDPNLSVSCLYGKYSIFSIGNLRFYFIALFALFIWYSPGILALVNIVSLTTRQCNFSRAIKNFMKHGISGYGNHLFEKTLAEIKCKDLDVVKMVCPSCGDTYIMNANTCELCPSCHNILDATDVNHRYEAEVINENDVIDKREHWHRDENNGVLIQCANCGRQKIAYPNKPVICDCGSAITLEDARKGNGSYVVNQSAN